MALFTTTVTSGTAREVYGGMTALDAYAFDMIGAAATAFRALTEDNRKRLLISATRYIDRKKWQGTANAFDSTTLAWPRDDIEDADGDAVSNAAQLALVNQAVFELAVIGASDSSIFDAADQGSNVKALGAGKARLEFFAPTKAGKGATTLPTVVNDLIGMWLAGSGAGLIVIGIPSSTGTDGCSSFDDDDDYERGP